MNDMTVDIARLTLECAEPQTLNTELRSKLNQLEIGSFIHSFDCVVEFFKVLDRPVTTDSPRVFILFELAPTTRIAMNQ